MLFLIGYGHRTKKSFGYEKGKYCHQCYRDEDANIQRVTTWVTLFFIPCIPVDREYYLVCQGCGKSTQITKNEFKAMIIGKEKAGFDFSHNEDGVNCKPDLKSSGRYQTKVQKNFWAEMDAFDQEEQSKSK